MPERLTRLALAVAAVLVAASLFARWRQPETLVIFGAQDRLDEAFDAQTQNGFERFAVFDVVLLLVAAGLAVLAVALRRVPRRGLAAAAVTVAGAAVAVVAQGIGPGAAATGPAYALCGLGLAVLALLTRFWRPPSTTL